MDEKKLLDLFWQIPFLLIGGPIAYLLLLLPVAFICLLQTYAAWQVWKLFQ